MKQLQILLALPLITIIAMSTSSGRLDNLRITLLLVHSMCISYFLGFFDDLGHMWAPGAGANNFSNARELKHVQCIVVRGNTEKNENQVMEDMDMAVKILIKPSFKDIRKSLEYKKIVVCWTLLMQITTAAGWCTQRQDSHYEAISWKGQMGQESNREWW